MSSPRKTWLKSVGVVVLLLLLVVAVLAARYASLRAEHQRLRELEVGRAPVVGPKRLTPNLRPVPLVVSCIHGVVLDRGAPVSGMQISVSDSPPSVSGDCPCQKPVGFCGCREGLALVTQLPRAGLVEAVKSDLSDANGHFEVCGLESEGPRLIWGEHLDGRLAVSRSEGAPFTQAGASVELQVVVPVAAQGLVRAGQSPVAGATVFAFSTPPVFVRTFTTDANGRFDTPLLLGTSDFVVSAPNLPPQRVNEVFTPQRVLVLELQPQSEITVRALFEGRPVAGAEVIVAPEAPVLTDTNGLARFPLRVKRDWTVRVLKGELIGSSTINVLEGQPRRIDVTLKKGVRVRGVVTDEQGQPRQAKVRELGRSKPLLTDEHGAFTSELLLPSSEVYPRASAEGCADSEYRQVRLGEVDLVMTLKVSCTEAANGVVLDAEGKPVEDALVFLDGFDHRESVTTDASGSFRFHQPPAMYQLKVKHERYRQYEQPLQLPAKDVTIVLDAGGSISGRIVDAKGVGLVGIAVTVVPAVLDALLSEIEGGNTGALTDPDGHFTVTGLLAGRLVVSATGDSLGTVVSDVVVLQPGEHREGVVLTLDERIDLSGTVMDEQRRPIPGARISWDPADEKAALVGLLVDAVHGHVDQVMRARHPVTAGGDGGNPMKWPALVKLGLQRPEVEEGIWFRTPSLKVRGKSFVRLKEDGVTVVFLVETVDAQQFLIHGMPAVYFITPHYEGWPAVLARLSKLSVKEAKLRLRQAWELKAPAKLFKVLPARNPSNRVLRR